MAPSSNSSSGSSTEGRSLFSYTPLPMRRSGKHFPSSNYLAVAAQVVHYGGASQLPMVARVLITDYRGNVVLDTFIRPTQYVTDYRTEKTGIRPVHLGAAPTFEDVQRHVAGIIKDKILVGYALWKFLSVFGISHPALETRDTALFMPFRKSLKVKPSFMVPLETLVQRLMGHYIGLNGEVAVEEARAALDLFRSCEALWEDTIKSGSWPCCLPPSAYGNCFT
ncbi:hypothetical protein QCA50_001582 [Cerrena zonata]|uniref:Exonuclease domain-containing protein n=1 Tax=Cerrena zonata TaxID=2478898 RepID=A0AAW0GXG4_9APHY